MRRALWLVLLLAGCDDGPMQIPRDPNDAGAVDAGARVDAGRARVDAGTDAGPPPAALVRFVHASPSAPNVDLRAANGIAATDVYYRAATPLLRVPVGEGTLSAVDGDAIVATSAPTEFEQGVHYVAVLTATGLVVQPEGSRPAPFAVRAINATSTAIDVDLDGAPREREITDLAPGASSAWVALDPLALRPIVGQTPFTVESELDPWLMNGALLVIAGRETEPPSERDGLSIVLALPATEEASPFFVLRPDPRLAILQASPRLPEVEVSFAPADGGDRFSLATDVAYGALIEASVPPGNGFVYFIPPGELFGPSDNVDLLPGHRYLLVAHGDPESFGDDRFRTMLVRDGIEGDGFVVLNAAPDSPGPLKWYQDDDVFTLAIGYRERSTARGIGLDPARRLGVGRQEALAPNVWFTSPSSPGRRGFVVLAGSYFGEPHAFWVFAPVGAPWSAQRTGVAGATPER